MLEAQHSKLRHARLQAVLAERKLDAVVVGARHHAYYFSAHLPFWQHEGAFMLFADGESILIAGNHKPGEVAADSVLPFDAHYAYTLRQEQPQVVADVALESLRKRRASRIGIDTSAVTSPLALGWERKACVAIDADLWAMRRAKDPDEIALMETAIECTVAMHAKAREMIRPGVTETEVYGALHAAAVERAGEPLSAWLGNDYRCACPGGPPRGDRQAQAGEIYILDLGPAYRGYFADNARSYSVGGKPTAPQMKVWEAIMEIFPLVESMVRPGARCREIHDAAAESLRSATGMEMAHHLGHGVGLQPHEYPHLNPAWDDVLVEGEVLTVEPGLYSPELAGGMRIENQYLVTSEGVRNLVDIPMELCL